MAEQLFNQTSFLIRFILRRDRVRLSIWLISIALITFVTASAFTNLYQSEAERQTIAETMKNPAMIAMVGQGYGLDNYTNGAMMAHQMLLFTAMAVGIMSILLVTRHTRADEEDGRTEMIRSLPVGRLANLHATISVLAGINVMLALIVGFGLYALGIDSMDLKGSLLYGAALGVTGIFFAGLTSVFAQLTESSRGTIGLAIAFLLLSYLVRAVGDVGNEVLSWSSPLGWVLGSEVYVNNYWWPVLLTLGVSVILFAIAFYLNGIRDVGAGFIPSRPGRKNASPFLKSPFGLALRLQRTGLISWAIGMFILGISYGSVLGDLESFFGNNEMLAELITPTEGYTMTEQFLTMLMSVISMICTIPPLMAILKLKGEEKKNRTEHLLSRAVSRKKLMGSYLIIAILSSLGMLVLAVLGLNIAGSAVMEEAIPVSKMLSAALVYLPAIWMMVGLAVFLIGFAPKLTGFSYLYLTYSFFVVYLGALLQLPDWMGELSPFGHIPQLPVDDMNYPVVSLLTMIALLLIMAGFIGYKNRDLEG